MFTLTLVPALQGFVFFFLDRVLLNFDQVYISKHAIKKHPCFLQLLVKCKQIDSQEANINMKIQDSYLKATVDFLICFWKLQSTLISCILRRKTYLQKASSQFILVKNSHLLRAADIVLCNKIPLVYL